VFSGRGLSDELITRPEEFSRLQCVVVCDQETSWFEEATARAGLQSQKNKVAYVNTVMTSPATLLKIKVPRNELESPEGGGRGIALHSLDLGARRGGWSAPRPDRFTPGEDPVPIVLVDGWAPGPVWTCAKNLAPTGIFFCPILLVSCTLLVWNCSGIRRKTACCEFFHYEKSDDFGRERTRDLGFQRPARKPLDHRSR
jgi:hypothetical protein